MQMDTCKIRPGLYQFTAIDDCSRFLVAGVARHRNAKSTLAFLDQVLDEMPFSIQRSDALFGAKSAKLTTQEGASPRPGSCRRYRAASVEMMSVDGTDAASMSGNAKDKRTDAPRFLLPI